MARVGDKPAGVGAVLPQPVDRAPQPPAASPAATAEVSRGWAATGRPALRTAGGPGDTASPDASARLAQLKALLTGHTDRGDEKKIIGLFKSAPPAELNAMLDGLSVRDFHGMVGDIDNRKFLGIKVGPQNRTKLIKALTQDRVADLSTSSRAKVIHGLQYHTTDSAAEAGIRDMFLNTKGAQLTDLKRAVDGGGDHRDLEQVVWHDVDDAGVRQQILEHFKKEAQPVGQVKVLSDIDDTFYVNLKDDRYPKQTVYPGLRSLYDELDKGPNARTPDATGDVTFISARPYDRPGIIEDDFTRKMLKKNEMGAATVRSGDLLHVVGNQAIADKKFDNWQKERQLYPEYQRVAFGDSGQGDMLLEKKALESGSDTAAAFLHNVTHLSDAERATYQSQGITVFDTHVGAATEAFKRGLISRQGLERVARDATTELAAVPFTDAAQKTAREEDLQRDLTAMRAALSAAPTN